MADRLELLKAAAVQAIIDDRVHPDGRFLSGRFYALLDGAGCVGEVLERADGMVNRAGSWVEPKTTESVG